jgi:anti-anti-sigma factor
MHDFSTAVRAGSVTVTGEIDMETAPVLREALAEAAAAPGPLVVDLSAVTFLDSAGVAALFDHVADDLEVIVRRGSIIARVLDVTGLGFAATVRHAAGR